MEKRFFLLLSVYFMFVTQKKFVGVTLIVTPGLSKTGVVDRRSYFFFVWRGIVKFSYSHFRQGSACQQVAKRNTPFCVLTGVNSSIFFLGFQVCQAVMMAPTTRFFS